MRHVFLTIITMWGWITIQQTVKKSNQFFIILFFSNQDMPETWRERWCSRDKSEANTVRVDVQEQLVSIWKSVRNKQIAQIGRNFKKHRKIVFRERCQEFYSSPLLLFDCKELSYLFLFSLIIHTHGKAMIFPFARAWTPHAQQSCLKRRVRLVCWLKKESTFTQPLGLYTGLATSWPMVQTTTNSCALLH